MLWVRPLDSPAARPLPGTEDAKHPFWSPDGRFLGFFSNGRLSKIDASGGLPAAVCDTPPSTDGRGGTWAPDGTILFGLTGDVIHRVPASGGTPVPVTALDESRGERDHRFPQFLPNGRDFIFLVVRSPGDPSSTGSRFELFAASLGTREKRPLVATTASARYAPSGHLLFLRGGTLVAQPFDLDTLALSGDAVPLAEGVRRSLVFAAVFTVSETGRLVFQPGPASEQARLVWRDHDGRERGVVGKPDGYRNPALSHDGRRVAASIEDPETESSDIWILDIERGTSTRLTFDPAIDSWPLWSRDDRTIYFTSSRSGGGDVYSKSSSGTGAAELVHGTASSDVLWSLSPAGKTGWLISSNPTGADIYKLDLESRESEVFLKTPFYESGPVPSPDGRWLLYVSDESGRYEAYVRSLGDDGGRWQISVGGGWRALWMRAGQEIVFIAPDGTLMAAGVTLEPAFSAKIPEPLFTVPDGGLNRIATTDGDRFLLVEPAEAPALQFLTLVQNWTRELEQ